MKRIAVSILLLSFIACHAQKKSTKSNPPPTEKATIDTIAKIDSTKETLIDSLTISDTVINHSQVKMILVKEIDLNWFEKYWFPFILLIIGAAIPFVWEYFAGNRRLKKIGARWAAEIKFLEYPLKDQISAIEDFSVQHKVPDYEIPQLYIIEGLNAEKFQTMDKGELLKYIQKFKEKNEKQATINSNRIHGYINIIKGTEAVLKEKFDEYMNKTSELNTRFSRNLTRISRAFGVYSVLLEIQYNGGNYIVHPHYKEIADLFQQHLYPNMATGLKLFTIKDNFLMGLMPVLAELRLDLRTHEMSDYLANCLEEIKQIDFERTYLQENLEIIKERFKEQLSELPEIKELIEITEKK